MNIAEGMGHYKIEHGREHWNNPMLFFYVEIGCSMEKIQSDTVTKGTIHWEKAILA